GVLSYSAPAAYDTAQGLYDSSYDGHRSQGVLFNGLGRLVDGEVGLDNYRLDIGYGKGVYVMIFERNTILPLSYRMLP
ncbi:hypothetical protein GWI33_002012, partial [Rhynchophorus ferrugineus]